MTTITRGEALDAIDAAEQMGALAYLAAFWTGDESTDADALRDFVGAHCVDGDRIRSYGPSDSDETDLAEWNGDEYEPEPRPTVTCSHCGEDVRDADSFPLSFGGNVCAPCFNRCSVED